MNLKSIPFIALLLIVGLSGCKKTENLLVKRRGDWFATTQLYQNYENGVLVSESSWSGTLIYHFEEDGFGYIESENASTSFTWSSDEKKDRLLLCEEQQECIWYDVLQSEKNVQMWFGTYGNANSYTDVTLRMVKQ